MKLTVSLIVANEKDVLRKCLISLREGISPGIEHEVIAVDNASEDGTSEILKKEFPEVKVIRNAQKYGFCKNHNIVIKNSSGEYVLILNSDIVATKSFVNELIKAIDSDKRIGCITGKLLLGDGSSDEKVIDITGLPLKKNRQAVPRGHGEEDKGQYDEPCALLAIDGAALLCRREMLEDIKLFGEYLDESFYAFKEDQDLCWRARLRGWDVRYTPKAVAYHLRGWGKKRKRKTVPRFIRQHSFKNRYLLMLKNDYLINWLIALPFILWFEVRAFVYMLFREPHLFLAWVQFLKLLPLTLRKRRAIMKRAVVSPRGIRKWFI
ncbi:glycosyltransferase family 2 protein [Candidatus Margulisiibacteriota bacterium]